MLGAILILCSVIFLKPILRQLGAIESVMPYAISYTSIYITFSIFNVFNVTMNNIVSSEGAAKTAMSALMAGALLNVVLDPVFIYALHFGVAFCEGYSTNRPKGFQPIAVFSFGAKKFDRLHEAIKTSTLWSTVFCVVFGLSAAIFPSQIMALFTKGDMEMIRVGSVALRANGLSFLLFGFYTVYSFLFLVMGKAAKGCILGAC